jgi:phasin
MEPDMPEIPQMPQFAEMPESVRGIMKSSIEQAKRAFDTFVSTSSKMFQNMDVTSSATTDSMKSLNEKIATFTRQNAESNFNLALKLADARQLSEVVEIQTAHVRDQMETFSRQLEELRDLTTKVVKESSRQTSSAVQEAVHSAQTAMHNAQDGHGHSHS